MPIFEVVRCAEYEEVMGQLVDRHLAECAAARRQPSAPWKWAKHLLDHARKEPHALMRVADLPFDGGDPAPVANFANWSVVKSRFSAKGGKKGLLQEMFARGLVDFPEPTFTLELCGDGRQPTAVVAWRKRDETTVSGVAVIDVRLAHAGDVPEDARERAVNWLAETVREAEGELRPIEGDGFQAAWFAFKDGKRRFGRSQLDALTYAVDAALKLVAKAKPSVGQDTLRSDHRLSDILPGFTVAVDLLEPTDMPGGASLNGLRLNAKYPKRWPDRSGHSTAIARRQFAASTRPAFPSDVSNNSCSVLVSHRVARHLDHCYNVEPAGVIPVQDGVEVESVGHVHGRLHRARLLPESLESFKFLKSLLPNYRDEEYDRVPPPNVYVATGDPVSASRIGLWVVGHLRGQDAKPLVLHWQGRSRADLGDFSDLLYPVTQSLRKMCQANLLCSKRVVERQVDAWLGRHLGTQTVAARERCERIKCLLFGSLNNDAMSDIVDDLYELFRACCTTPLVVVCSNWSQLDESTLRLVDKLGRRDSLRGDRLCLVLVDVNAEEARASSGPVAGAPHSVEEPHQLRVDPGLPAWVDRDKQVSLRLQSATSDAPRHSRQFADCTPEQQRLLRVMATLGWDVPRMWLRNVWREVDTPGQPRTEEDFNRVVAGLLEGGIIETNGCLANLIHPDRPMRELRFTSLGFYDQIRGALRSTPALVTRVANAFVTRLSGMIRTVSAMPQLPGAEPLLYVRCKARAARICNLADDEHRRRHRLLIAGLAHSVGFRAHRAKAYQEAKLRLEKAIETITSDDLVETQETATLASRILAWYRVNFDSLAQERELLQPTPVAMPLTATLSRIRFAEGLTGEFNDGERARLQFDLYRHLWSYIFRWGSKLELASTFASDLGATLPPLPGSPADPDEFADLRLEAHHVAAVTHFARGDLPAAIDSAGAARQLCLDHKGFAKAYQGPETDDPCGSHDAGACAKVHRALAMLLRDGCSPESTSSPALDALQEAMDYARTLPARRAPTTCVTVNYYARLFHILKRDFDAASDHNSGVVCSNDSVHARWRVADQLMKCCAEIGRIWKPFGEPAPGRSPAVAGELDSGARQDLEALRRQLEDLRRQWAAQEFESLWMTWQALCLALENGPHRCDEARRSFDRTVFFARERQELFYLPETLAFRCWFERDMCKDEAAAESARLEGLRAASTMGDALRKERVARLYVDRLDGLAAVPNQETRRWPSPPPTS